MNKIDLKKDLKQFYAPSPQTVEVVDVPEMAFLMADGEIESGGAPDRSPAFQNTIRALYGAAYTMKFMSKRRPNDPLDFTVMPLEGLWWSKSGAFELARMDDFRWTLMIGLPDQVTSGMMEEALVALRAKQGPLPPSLRLERFHEGLSIQIMHVGPYADEPRSVAKLVEFAAGSGYKVTGKHHEIYLGDPRRAKPERLKTVLRYAVAREA